MDSFAVQPKGKLIIDKGAQEAIEESGGSLLVVGVLEHMGHSREAMPSKSSMRNQN